MMRIFGLFGAVAPTLALACGCGSGSSHTVSTPAPSTAFEEFLFGTVAPAAGDVSVTNERPDLPFGALRFVVVGASWDFGYSGLGVTTGDGQVHEVEGLKGLTTGSGEILGIGNDRIQSIDFPLLGSASSFQIWAAPCTGTDCAKAEPIIPPVR